MEKKKDNKSDGIKKVAIIVVVIGCLGALDSAFIDILPDIIQPISTNEPDESESQEIALLDNFDDTSGSYDPNLWTCDHECGNDNIYLKNGALNLHRRQEGWSSLLSRSRWSYYDILSLEGKLQINSGSDLTVGWLGFDKSAGCDFEVHDSPFMQCYLGPMGDRDYYSDEIAISYETWHKIKIEFGHDPLVIRYFLDDVLIGEYFPDTYPEIAQIYVGIYVQDGVNNGLVYVDDVKLTIKK
jgi:hypothetical protein